jgi:hypothetical protein
MKSKPAIVISKILSPIYVAAIVIMLSTSAVKANHLRSPLADSATIEGRWDITIDMAGKEVPSWLEVRHSGLSTLVGYFVGSSGSARPVSKVNFSGGKMSFTIPPQWETGNDVSVEGTLQGNNLAGTILLPDGKSYSYTAVRAPSLQRAKEPSWGKPDSLVQWY